MLEIKNVNKIISKPLYKNLSITFTNGLYAIIGNNGCGKTTLLDMLAGVSPQDSGIINLSGNIRNLSPEYKKQLIYVPDNPKFFPAATGLDFLNLVTSAKKLSLDRNFIEEALNRFDLMTHLNKKFSSMSFGTQKKFFLSILLLGKWGLAVLDEPTNGIDDDAMQTLRDILKKYSKNCIIIFASHDNAFIESLSPTILKLKNCPVTNLTSITTEKTYA